MQMSRKEKKKGKKKELKLEMIQVGMNWRAGYWQSAFGSAPVYAER